MARKIFSSSTDKLEGEDGLLKIPVEALLKVSQQEVGELKAYIDELEDTISNLQSKLKEQIKFYKGINEHLLKRKNVYKRTLKNILSAILNSSSFEECIHNVNQSVNIEDLHNMNKQINNLHDFLKYQSNG